MSSVSDGLVFPRIHFIHEKKAAYPEIAAYKDYFSRHFDSDEMTFSEARDQADLKDAICWHMMGLYPRRLPAALVVHDYRSLSVGRAKKIKDRLKVLANHRPDLRIFQNNDIKMALGFRDDVPEFFLPMGVPDDILRYRNLPSPEPVGDYCYIGSMLPERRIDVMIRSFLARFGAQKSLWLYGNPDPDLVRMFADHANIVFPGMIPQEDLFPRLRGFGACVCYFPNHHPHVLQTPTKLLEYAALGLRIIANEQPQSRLTAAQYGIKCQWGAAHDMFADASDAFDWPDNSELSPETMLWHSVIEGSGVEGALEKFVRGRERLSRPETSRQALAST